MPNEANGAERYPTAEHKRLGEEQRRDKHWRRWGPYVSERQWGTVREDYSPNGTAWDYFPHDHARSRAYRWGEDGLAGISDNHQRLCFAIALWNERDPILKERLFGLSGPEGNHGEDVKETYFYLDNLPSHAYMKMLYKYPQRAYPYSDLVNENRRRGRAAPEYELENTGIFDDGRYFDVFVEYAKADTDDILIAITAHNRGSAEAPLHILPTLWFRNTWSWAEEATKPSLFVRSRKYEDRFLVVEADHDSLGKRCLYIEGGSPLLFTENETNTERIYGRPNATPYVKDAFHRYVVGGEAAAVNPAMTGTKCAAHVRAVIPARGSLTVRLRLSKDADMPEPFGTHFNDMLATRKKEADTFYDHIAPRHLSLDLKKIQRQAFAGLLWTKQFYNYVVPEWLKGDPTSPPPQRVFERNKAWEHVYSEDILSMPDKWEYPWFAAWDLAFHTIPLAMIDPDFAKRQLEVLTREWYMHPNGQLPAYEWAFDDVNPPVHAWAAWRVYKIERKMTGRGDHAFLERVFQKLLLNFTWWVNRKDTEGRNIFQGGFLGLDNIGVFDRSAPLPMGGHLEQSDGTSWMGMYCLNLFTIAVELTQFNPSYEDIASKFLEHFLYIASAMNLIGGKDVNLWNEEDGFYYDVLHQTDGRHIPLKVRSMVGIIPLFAIETLEISTLFKLPGLSRRFKWFMDHRPDLAKNVTCNGEAGMCERRILSIVTPDQLRRILTRVLDENEFFGVGGIRALSRYHKDHPYVFVANGVEHRVDYEPAESSTGLFGGNSNWRGPVWMPANYLLVESLQKFHHYLGDDFKVECPTGSGRLLTLWQVAEEISRRLVRPYLQDSARGQRLVNGGRPLFESDPDWRDLFLFYEYFNGDTAAGVGASHQTGWTGLIAKLIQQLHERSSLSDNVTPGPHHSDVTPPRT